MINDKVFYKTSNLNLATTLYTIGFPIDGIYKADNSEIMEFYFELKPELEKAVDSYWAGRLSVEPNQLFTNRKEILDHLKKDEHTNS